MNDKAAQFRKEVFGPAHLTNQQEKKEPAAIAALAIARRSCAENVLCPFSHPCFHADVSMGKQALLKYKSTIDLYGPFFRWQG